MASLGRQGKESDVKHSRHASDRIHVKLYVTGTTPNAVRAREAMEALVASAPDTAIEFTVIDVLANPEAALADGVFATPTVIRTGQGIERRLVGDLSSVEKLQIGLFIDAAA
jgi:circadian clock protein KaiB